MLEAGGGGGLFGPLGVEAQPGVRGDLGPGVEGLCLTGVEIGKQLEIGFGARLVGAEEFAEFGEFVPQRDGPQVVGDEPLGDPAARGAPARRPRGAGADREAALGSDRASDRGTDACCGTAAPGALALCEKCGPTAEKVGARAAGAEASAPGPSLRDCASAAGAVATTFAVGWAAAQREQHSMTCHQRPSRSVTTARTTAPPHRQGMGRSRGPAGRMCVWHSSARQAQYTEGRGAGPARR